jgi:molecular chaperone GrpE (heat shock protein)
LVRYQIKDEGFLWAIAEHDGMLVRCCLDFDVRYARQRAAEANRKWADTLAESRRQLEEARTQAWRTEASIAHLQKMRDKEDADAASVFRYHRDRLPLADAFEELQALPQLFIAT